ncbi:MAG: hypothetical protein AAGC57_00930 [Pseudomonadota bacterium]
MRAILLACAVGFSIGATSAGAATFVFDESEFFPGGIGNPPLANTTSGNLQIPERIFGPGGVIISSGGLNFLVTARQTNGTGARVGPNNGVQSPSLFVPSIDLPFGSATDTDLSVQGVDFDPIVNGSLNGELDPNPLGVDAQFSPLASEENSLVVQDPGTTAFVNDFAPSSGNLGVLEFELLTANPVIIERLTFIDDVDARVFTSMNPGNNFISAPGTNEIGEIQIDASGTLPPLPGGGTPPDCDIGGGGSAGDNCVAGLSFTNIVIEQGESFVVAFDGSGGVLGFEVTEIPLPASAYMILGAFGMLSFVGWRRRRSAEA